MVGARAAPKGLDVVCIDARHARAALKMRINKTDQNDAEGIAQIMRTGWYRPVHVKSFEAHRARALLGLAPNSSASPRGCRTTFAAF